MGPGSGCSGLQSKGRGVGSGVPSLSSNQGAARASSQTTNPIVWQLAKFYASPQTPHARRRWPHQRMPGRDPREYRSPQLTEPGFAIGFRDHRPRGKSVRPAACSTEPMASGVTRPHKPSSASQGAARRPLLAGAPSSRPNKWLWPRRSLRACGESCRRWFAGKRLWQWAWDPEARQGPGKRPEMGTGVALEGGMAQPALASIHRFPPG